MFYIGPMERIGVRDLNQNTSQVLARVRRGETVEVTERGRPIARLVPVDGGLTLLDRLVAEGRAVAPVSGGPLPLPPALGDPDVNVAEELAAAREEERW
jgi:prevent-host-death family protein